MTHLFLICEACIFSGSWLLYQDFIVSVPKSSCELQLGFVQNCTFYIHNPKAQYSWLLQKCVFLMITPSLMDRLKIQVLVNFHLHFFHVQACFNLDPAKKPCSKCMNIFLSFTSFFHSNPSWHIFSSPFSLAPIGHPWKIQQYFISDSRCSFHSTNCSVFQKHCSLPGSQIEGLLKHQQFFLLSGLTHSYRKHGLP